MGVDVAVVAPNDFQLYVFVGQNLKILPLLYEEDCVSLVSVLCIEHNL